MIRKLGEDLKLPMQATNTSIRQKALLFTELPDMEHTGYSNHSEVRLEIDLNLKTLRVLVLVPHLGEPWCSNENENTLKNFQI